jgi:hypothetical protein
MKKQAKENLKKLINIFIAIVLIAGMAIPVIVSLINI